MTQRLRFAAIHLALAAMMLRGFLPVGWMPNPDGAAGSLFVICTMDGPIQQADQHQGNHTPDNGQHSHEECPFAAAPHLAAPLNVAQIALPSYSARFVALPGIAASAIAFAAYQPHSPRAPPRNA